MSYVNGSCQLCANRNLFEFSIETSAEHPHLIYGVIHTNRVSIFLILSGWQNWNSKLLCNLFKCKNFSIAEKIRRQTVYQFSPTFPFPLPHFPHECIIVCCTACRKLPPKVYHLSWMCRWFVATLMCLIESFTFCFVVLLTRMQINVANLFIQVKSFGKLGHNASA